MANRFGLLLAAALIAMTAAPVLAMAEDTPVATAPIPPPPPAGPPDTPYNVKLPTPKPPAVRKPVHATAPAKKPRRTAVHHARHQEKREPHPATAHYKPPAPVRQPYHVADLPPAPSWYRYYPAPWRPAPAW